MVMDFIRGKTLFEIDGRNNLLLKDYEHDLERIFTETRSRGLVPQDVHLNNMMLDHSGKLYIVDVGKYHYEEEQRSYRTKSFWTSSSSSFGWWGYTSSSSSWGWGVTSSPWSWSYSSSSW